MPSKLLDFYRWHLVYYFKIESVWSGKSMNFTSRSWKVCTARSELDHVCSGTSNYCYFVCFIFVLHLAVFYRLTHYRQATPFGNRKKNVLEDFFQFSIVTIKKITHLETWNLII